MFFIDNGEIILRKVLPESSGKSTYCNSDNFWEWARKRQIEIGMMDLDQARIAQVDLDGRTASVKDMEEALQKLDSDGVRS